MCTAKGLSKFLNDKDLAIQVLMKIIQMIRIRLIKEI